MKLLANSQAARMVVHADKTALYPPGEYQTWVRAAAAGEIEERLSLNRSVLAALVDGVMGPRYGRRF